MPIDQDEFLDNFYSGFLSRFGGLEALAKTTSGTSAIDSGLLDPFTASIFEYGNSIAPEAQAAGAAYHIKVPAVFAELFERIDVLLSPAMPDVSIEGAPSRPTQLSTLPF